MVALATYCARTVPLCVVGLPFPSRALRVLVGLILGLAVLGAQPSVDGAVALPVLWIRELVTGAVLGFVMSVPFRAAAAAGALVDRSRRAGAPHDALSRALMLFALAIFAAVSGPALWIDALGQSYVALPIGHAPTGGNVLVEATLRLIVSAIELAAPALSALLVADLVIGLLARSAPALVATGGGRAARDLLGLLAILFSAGAVAASLAGGFGRLSGEMVAAARALASSS